MKCIKAMAGNAKVNKNENGFGNGLGIGEQINNGVSHLKRTLRIRRVTQRQLTKRKQYEKFAFVCVGACTCRTVDGIGRMKDA